MRYGLLGSTVVSGAPIGPRQVRVVLAVLLSQANQPVTTELLAQALWPRGAPDTAQTILQGRVSALRKILGPRGREVIQTTQGSYTLRVDEGEFDVAEFIRLTEEGHRVADHGDLTEASRLLRAGLELWRGKALQDCQGGPVLTGYASRLEERKLAALEKRYELDIALENPQEAIGGLTELVAEDARQENFAALLMDALTAVGRTADAQQVFDNTCAALGRLGVSLGPRLRQARSRLDAATGITAPAPSVVRRPAQVPAQIPDFTGRDGVLERISAALTGDGSKLVALGGPGGIGKSTLAVRAAHLLRFEFDGGQVVADLSAEPAQPSDVLRRFLLSVGVPEEAIPHGFVERQQLWRSRTADARVLVLLDDARDETQVRALLPSGEACGVLVTARKRMLGLAGATTIPVDAFTGEEAEALLSGAVGAERLAAEPRATRRLLGLCAGLPLAVRIVGAKLAARPHETIEELCERIGAGRSRLAELRAGDLDVRATIEPSYTDCAGQPRRALRLLGVLGLPAVSRPLLARLLDVPEAAATEAAESLVEAQLLQVSGRDAFGQVCYRMHDLIAEFAREKAESEETSESLEAALDRVLGALLGALHAADQRLRLQPGGGTARQHGPESPDPLARCAQEAPSEWCANEAGNVVAAIRAALDRGWWDRAWVLADAFARVARVRPGMASARTIAVLGMYAARRAGQLWAEATSLRRLGEVHWERVTAASTLRYLRAAAARFERLRDDTELARTLIVEADVLGDTGQVSEARERLDQSIRLAKAAGAGSVHAAALHQLGSLLADLGELMGAEHCFVESLALAREAGDERAVISALKRRADVLRRGRRYDEARALLEEALEITATVGDTHWEAHVLRSLGEVQRYAGELTAARENMVRSLELFTEHGHRHAAAYSLRGLADLHAQLKEYEQAADALERCRTVFEALADRRGQAYALRSWAALCVRTGHWEQAEQALVEAQRICADLSLHWFARDAARALEQVRRRTTAG